ncbi:MAG: sensor histidine kinase [Dorea sp.]
MLWETACKFAAIKKIPISFQADVPDREMLCSSPDMLRAWNNLLSNAVEYTEKESGIEVIIQGKWQENQEYMVVSVRDFGPGFTEKDLQYADREFYSGDASRHDRTHQGLGLAIAKRFLNEQGGFLQYGNHADGGGEVSMWIVCWNEENEPQSIK